MKLKTDQGINGLWKVQVEQLGCVFDYCSISKSEAMWKAIVVTGGHISPHQTPQYGLVRLVRSGADYVPVHVWGW